VILELLLERINKMKTRREALAILAGAAGMTTGMLPDKLTRPLVEKVIVPAHAQTSPPVTTTPAPPGPTTTNPPGTPTTTRPPEEPTTTPEPEVIELAAYKQSVSNPDTIIFRDGGLCGDTLVVTAPDDERWVAVVKAFVDGIESGEVIKEGYGTYQIEPYPGCEATLVFKGPHS
jgi:hypothetical protein